VERDQEQENCLGGTGKKKKTWARVSKGKRFKENGRNEHVTGSSLWNLRPQTIYKKNEVRFNEVTGKRGAGNEEVNWGTSQENSRRGGKGLGRLNNERGPSEKTSETNERTRSNRL